MDCAAGVVAVVNIADGAEMKCSDCKWYKPFGAESTDQCLHENSVDKIGGIRHDFISVYRTCEAMLAGRCKDHKLFEAAI